MRHRTNRPAPARAVAARTGLTAGAPPRAADALRRGWARAVARVVAACALALCAVSPAPALANAGVLVAGPEPLTVDMVERATAVLGEALGKPVPPALRQRLRALYIEHWRALRRQEMDTVRSLVELSQALQTLAPPAREQALVEFRAALLAGLREAAPADADARALLALHEEAAREDRPRSVPPAAAPGAASAALLAAPTGRAAPPREQAQAAALPATVRRTIVAPAAGVNYTPPPGWQRQQHADATVFETRLRPEPRADHAARLVVYRPRPAPRGIAAAFEEEWRQLVAAPLAAAADTVAHYRNRLPGGVDAYFMGRFFALPGQTQEVYVVLYVLDLGSQTQSIVASVIGGWDGVGYPGAIDGSAHHALSQALFPLLDSIHVPGQRAAGPLFDATEVRGTWAYSDGSYGGSFVNAATGAPLGAAVRGASSMLALRDDGSYDYHFAMYAVNPNAGTDIAPQAEKHGGRYEFADDVIVWRPRQGAGSDPRRKVVGSGVRNTPQGPRRLLIVVGPSDRAFKPPMWVPLGDRYDGVMHWYVEDRAAR